MRHGKTLSSGDYPFIVELRNLTLCVTTDVHIPSFPARAENTTFRDHIALARDNFLNTLKNITRCATLLPYLYSVPSSWRVCSHAYHLLPCAIPLLARAPPSFPKESDVLTIFSMRKLAQENSFPGQETQSARSFQIFQATSAKDSAWVAPLRAILLENYKRVNNAIAE